MRRQTRLQPQVPSGASSPARPSDLTWLRSPIAGFLRWQFLKRATSEPLSYAQFAAEGVNETVIDQRAREHWGVPDPAAAKALPPKSPLRSRMSTGCCINASASSHSSRCACSIRQPRSCEKLAAMRGRLRGGPRRADALACTACRFAVPGDSVPARCRGRFLHHAAKLAGGNNAIALLCNTLRPVRSWWC